MGTLIKRLDHYCIYTDDARSVVDFYKKLGLEEGMDADKPTLIGSDFMIKVHGPDSEATPVPRNVAKGSIDLCFESHLTPEEITRNLEQKGIPLYEGPVPGSDPGVI